VVMAPVVGKILPKSELRVLATLSFVGFAAVYFMRSHYTTGVDAYTLVLPTLLQGIPTGLFFVPLTAIILSGQPAEKVPAAAGLSNFVRVFCGAVGTSLATTGWNNRAILHHAQLSEQARVHNPLYARTIESLQATMGFTQGQAAAYFERGLNTQAIMLGLNDIFWISGVIFVAIVPLIWLTKPARGGSAATAAAAH